jgi:hypothetical protein
MASPQDQQVP